LVLLKEVNDENGVTPRAPIILVCAGDGARLLANHQSLEDVFWTCDADLCSIEHDNLPILLLAHLQILCGWLCREQVIESFLIDLEVVHTDFEGRVVGLHDLVHSVENFENCARNNTVQLLDLLRDDLVFVRNALRDYIDDLVRSEHRERLTRTGLAVSKDCPIEALEQLLHGLLRYIIVRFRLGSVRVENTIKSKPLWSASSQAGSTQRLLVLREYPLVSALQKQQSNHVL
jgi:hypothetical protein